MDLFRQVLGGRGEGGEDGGDDGLEEEALLAHEGDSSSSQTSSDEEGEERTDNARPFDVSLPARHLVSCSRECSSVKRRPLALCI